MSDNSEEIVSLLEEYSRIDRGERRLKAIQTELYSLQEQREELKARVAKEYQDVVTLESSSMKYIFSTILRNRQEQLEKERQEYLLATIAYNDCEQLIASLQYEARLLRAKALDKEQVIKELDHKINDLLAASPETTSGLQEEFTLINKDIKRLQRLMTEAHEAEDIARELQEHFYSMIMHMNEAKTYDNWGEFYVQIQKGKKLRKEHIDKAQGELLVIKRLLVFLIDELKDVEEVHEEFKRSEVIIRNFKIKYYRHLVSDWIEASDLAHALTSTMKASKAIDNMIASIGALRKSIKEEVTFTLSRREQLIQRMVDRSL